MREVFIIFEDNGREQREINRVTSKQEAINYLKEVAKEPNKYTVKVELL